MLVQILSLGREPRREHENVVTCLCVFIDALLDRADALLIEYFLNGNCTTRVILNTRYHTLFSLNIVDDDLERVYRGEGTPDRVVVNSDKKEGANPLGEPAATRISSSNPAIEQDVAGSALDHTIGPSASKEANQYEKQPEERLLPPDGQTGMKKEIETQTNDAHLEKKVEAVTDTSDADGVMDTSSTIDVRKGSNDVSTDLKPSSRSSFTAPPKEPTTDFASDNTSTAANPDPQVAPGQILHAHRTIGNSDPVSKNNPPAPRGHNDDSASVQCGMPVPPPSASGTACRPKRLSLFDLRNGRPMLAKPPPVLQQVIPESHLQPAVENTSKDDSASEGDNIADTITDFFTSPLTHFIGNPYSYDISKLPLGPPEVTHKTIEDATPEYADRILRVFMLEPKLAESVWKDSSLIVHLVKRFQNLGKTSVAHRIVCKALCGDSIHKDDPELLFLRLRSTLQLSAKESMIESLYELILKQELSLEDLAQSDPDAAEELETLMALKTAFLDAAGCIYRDMFHSPNLTDPHQKLLKAVAASRFYQEANRATNKSDPILEAARLLMEAGDDDTISKMASTAVKDIHMEIRELEEQSQFGSPKTGTRNVVFFCLFFLRLF